MAGALGALDMAEATCDALWTASCSDRVQVSDCVLGSAAPAAEAVPAFAEHGPGALAKFERALLAEARLRPDASGRALSRATSELGLNSGADVHTHGPGCAPLEAAGTEFVETALAQSLERFEASMLTRSGDHAVIRAHDMLLRDDLAGRSAAAFDPMGKRRQPPRPASAPLGRRRGDSCHAQVADTPAETLRRQREYDDRRRGRAQFSVPAYPRPQAQRFDPAAPSTHHSQPVRVRRDENGRLLQPRVSARLSRISMPSFLGKAIEPPNSPPINWEDIAREATSLIWTETTDVIMRQRAVLSSGMQPGTRVGTGHEKHVTSMGLSGPARRRRVGGGRGQAKATENCVKVTLLRGRNLPIMDHSKSDPYAKLALGKITKTSTVKRGQLNPDWDEAFFFTIADVAQALPPLTIEVFDEDLEVGKARDQVPDDLLGRVEIVLEGSAADLKARGGVRQWFALQELPEVGPSGPAGAQAQLELDVRFYGPEEAAEEKERRGRCRPGHGERKAKRPPRALDQYRGRSAAWDCIPLNAFGSPGRADLRHPSQGCSERDRDRDKDRDRDRDRDSYWQVRHADLRHASQGRNERDRDRDRYLQV